jgi:hypothetical protein
VQRSAAEQLAEEGEAKRHRRSDAEAGCVFSLHAVVVVVVVVVVIVARSDLRCGGAICGCSLSSVARKLLSLLYIAPLQARASPALACSSPGVVCP